MKAHKAGIQQTERIKSVDFFRGFTMFLLAGEATGIFQFLNGTNSSFINAIGEQLEHHKWNGLHFWDLIQPFFMFIVGVSIPFAVANRIQKGDTQKSLLAHALKRSFLLLFFGWALYFIPTGIFVLKLQNVLAQLAVTYLIAFLIRNQSIKFQLIFSLLILLIMDLAYRYFPVEGFNHPWVNYQNLGAWVNNKLEGVEKSKPWASINAFSTTAHTIWGVVCGQVIRSKIATSKKIRNIVVAGLLCLVLGYGLDLANITPIIKKIATSSFVLVSGGWTLLGYILFYYVVDIKKWLSKINLFFMVIGANSIFIYLFFSIGATSIIAKINKPFVNLFFQWTDPITIEILTCLSVWFSMWYICFWLYNKKIFFKI